MSALAERSPSVSSPSTVLPSIPSSSTNDRDHPDVIDAYHTFLRDAANHPSPLPPGVTGVYWLYLKPLTLRRVSPEMHERARIRREMLGNTGGRLAAFARKSKFDYYANSSTLVITLQNREHEIASAFVQDFRRQMWDHGFYWPQWRYDQEQVRLSGACPVLLDYGGALPKFESDASLAWRTVRYPFLVCEVVNNETSHQVLEKMRPYLLGSRGMVRFFVVIKLERADTRPGKHLLTEALEYSKPAKRCRMEEAAATGAAGLYRAQRDSESRRLVPLQDEEEWIPGQSKGKVTKASISVYTSSVNPSITGVPTRAVETIFESLEVWPEKSVDGMTLSWNNFGVKNIPEAVRTKLAIIKFHRLHEFIATLVEDENKTPGQERLQIEVDGENVEIDWSDEPNTEIDDDE